MWFTSTYSIHISSLCRILLAAFTAIQPIADTFLFFIPFYYSAKVAFACYLWANDLAGAELVYTKYAQPFVTQYEPLVDEKIAELKSLASSLLARNMTKIVQKLQALVVAVLAQTHQAAANSLRAEAAGEAAPAAGIKPVDSFRSASSGSFDTRNGDASVRTIRIYNPYSSPRKNE